MRSFFTRNESSDSHVTQSFIRKPDEGGFISNSQNPSQDSFIPPQVDSTQTSRTNTLGSAEETETANQNIQRKCNKCDEGSESILTSGTSTMEEQEAESLVSTSTMEEQEQESLSMGTSTMEEQEAESLVSTSTMEEQEQESLSMGTSTMEEQEAESLVGTSTMEEQEQESISAGTSTMEEQEAESLVGTSTMEEKESETVASSNSETETLETETTTTGGSCSIQSSRFTSIPSGKIAAYYSGGKYGAAFNMQGNFGVNPPCNCRHGEYRQYVKGYFKKNGSTVTHPLCGTNLSSTNYQEDCGISGGKQYKYGYRNNKFATSYFSPDQAGGCAFVGYDHPGIRAASGDKVEINLQFVGKLVDTSKSNKVLKSSSWSVEGSKTIP